MTDANDYVVTHCVESLKNVILVFQSNGYFDKMSLKTGDNVWTKTWAILNDVTPDFHKQFVDSTNTLTNSNFNHINAHIQNENNDNDNNNNNNNNNNNDNDISNYNPQIQQPPI